MSRRGFWGEGGEVSQGSRTVPPSKALTPTMSPISSPEPIVTVSNVIITDITLIINNGFLTILQHSDKGSHFPNYISVISNNQYIIRITLERFPFHLFVNCGLYNIVVLAHKKVKAFSDPTVKLICSNKQNLNFSFYQLLQTLAH